MPVDEFLSRALRDPTTGLPNIPYLQLIREWEERRSQRRSYAVRLLKMRVRGGDERTLRSLGWHLTRLLRDSDFIASRGPTRFHILLTSSDAEHADALRGRITALVAGLNERNAGAPPLEVEMEVEEQAA